jgi:hypothetical protein
MIRDRESITANGWDCFRVLRDELFDKEPVNAAERSLGIAAFARSLCDVLCIAGPPLKLVVMTEIK